MATSPKGLSSFQQQAIDAIFKVESDLWLSGGAALIGYYLHHRTTTDLDLFTEKEHVFERAKFTLEETANRLQAKLNIRQQSANFIRVVLEKDQEGLVVDVVFERAYQWKPNKSLHGEVRVDPPEEILANKLTALVGRQEERDLLDVYCLERAGFQIEDALDAALLKDGGCTAANLAWLLSTFPLPSADFLPSDVTTEALQGWKYDLVERLRKIAKPSSR